MYTHQEKLIIQHYVTVVSKTAKNYLLVTSLVLVSQSLIFALNFWLGISPSSSQFFSDVTDTVLWILILYFGAFIVAEPEKCRPLTRKKGTNQIKSVDDFGRIVRRRISICSEMG
jgi:hypothetical protein